MLAMVVTVLGACTCVLLVALAWARASAQHYYRLSGQYLEELCRLKKLGRARPATDSTWYLMLEPWRRKVRELEAEVRALRDPDSRCEGR